MLFEDREFEDHYREFIDALETELNTSIPPKSRDKLKGLFATLKQEVAWREIQRERIERDRAQEAEQALAAIQAAIDWDR